MNAYDAGIVVAFDGSSASNEALDWAVEETYLRKCDLTIVSVAEVAGSSGPAETSGQEEPLRRARALLGRRAPATRVHVLTAAEVCEPALIDVLLAARLVVFGARGRRGMLAVSLGSISEQLVRQSGSPIVVLPEQTSTSTRHNGLVVLGVSRRHGEPAALRLALVEADARGATLEVLYATDDEGRNGVRLKGDESQALWLELLDTLQPLVPDWPHVRVAPVITRAPLVEALVKRSHDADLVVLGSSGMLGLTGLAHDPIERELMRRSLAPVMFTRTIDSTPPVTPVPTGLDGPALESVFAQART